MRSADNYSARRISSTPPLMAGDQPGLRFPVDRKNHRAPVRWFGDEVVRSLEPILERRARRCRERDDGGKLAPRWARRRHGLRQTRRPRSWTARMPIRRCRSSCTTCRSETGWRSTAQSFSASIGRQRSGYSKLCARLSQRNRSHFTPVVRPLSFSEAEGARHVPLGQGAAPSRPKEPHVQGRINPPNHPVRRGEFNHKPIERRLSCSQPSDN
jgi:hypothetical protein